MHPLHPPARLLGFTSSGTSDSPDLYTTVCASPVTGLVVKPVGLCVVTVVFVAPWVFTFTFAFQGTKPIFSRLYVVPSMVSCGAVELVPNTAATNVTAASRAAVIGVLGDSIEQDRSSEITTWSALIARVSWEVASTVAESKPSTRMKVVGIVACAVSVRFSLPVVPPLTG